MTTESAYLENTPRACENCGEESPRRFTVECSNCEGDITVCGDCVNANPRHEECPEEDA
jgi:hypothetical protein